jgi:hypothetical protein
MLKHNESKGNFKGLTAAEVSAAIRYLDSGPSDERRRDSNNAVLVIYVTWIVPTKLFGAYLPSLRGKLKHLAK